MGTHLQQQTTRSAWENGVAQELAWWRATLSRPISAWPSDLRNRLDAEALLQPHIARHLPDGDSAHILDCAAGPLTVLGTRHPTKAITITAVDALADHYAALLDGLRLTPPVSTHQCEVEYLDRRFPSARFDLVYMRFALDHCFDPQEALRQMIRVTKPGGAVMVEHYRDAAETAYAGLWQWDLRPKHDDLIVANPQRSFSVRETFPGVTLRMDTKPDWFTMIVRI